MLEVYDKSLKRIAFLQNAFEIKRTSVLSGVGSLSFKLPKDDPKLEYCQYMNFVRFGLKEDGIIKYTDYYRIAQIPKMEDSGVPYVEFYCEHGIITLIDKLLFGTFSVGGYNFKTRQVLEWILDKQDPVYWQLGDCDFSRQFEYNWTCENLLAALYSVPNCFSSDYIFTFDMSVFPWIVNLKAFDRNGDAKYYVHKRLNQLSIIKASNAAEIATRIYPLGYGEGINQLTIKDVNNGIPYLEAPKEIIEKYGIIERPFIDRRFTIAENLKERAQILLDEYCRPYEEYSVSVSDLILSNGNIDSLPEAGDIVYIASENLKTYITEVTTTLDIPGQASITIANKPRDVASTISNLADRLRIEQVYSQGATNIYSYTFRDNADPEKPLKESFWIPNEGIKINAVMLKYELRRFRAYEKGASTVESQLVTSSSGGQQSSTSSAGGAQSSTSSAGGGTITSTSSGGGQQSTSDSGGGSVQSSSEVLLTSSSIITEGDGGPGTAKHNHGIQPGVWLAKADGGAVQWAASGAHTHDAHGHTVSIPNHSHSFTIKEHTHSVTINAHTHSFSTSAHTHDFQIQAHTHNFTIPAHTHDIIYGIFEGGQADSVRLFVDGVEVPIEHDQTEIDIAPYLATDDSGRIKRGIYHTVELVPNKLTGITGSITVQLFIQSHGGGEF